MSGSRMKMSDVAVHAGVSTATVSRVLAGKAGVRDATRDKVRSSLEELGYQASSGSRQHGGPVAVVVPELTNPGFAKFVDELDFALAGTNLPMVVLPASALGTSEVQHLDHLMEMQISGLVSISGTPADSYADNQQYHRLIRAGLPVVFLNAHAPDLEGPFFSCSDADAVNQAVAHLTSLGHRRIGLATGQTRYLPSRRKIEALVELGYELEKDVASTIFTAEGGQAAAKTLLDTGHTAIICGSDVMALGVIREVRARGMSVPDDVSVIGFDDSPLMAFTDPPLTTIRQPARAMCDAAVKALLALLAGEDPGTHEMLFPPDLIIRQTTGPTP